VINVVAIVNGPGVTSAIVQSSSTTRISSGDANPAVLTTAAAGTVPTAPAG
jgi:hypothetical protein